VAAVVRQFLLIGGHKRLNFVVRSELECDDGDKHERKACRVRDKRVLVRKKVGTGSW
jgi:hypothetical protein